MDTIYAAAFLTIVATDGKHANAGLPGLRDQSRHPPKICRIRSDLSLLITRASIGRMLIECPWEKRAWTYQEGVLSTRLLMFTNNTVNFTCCSTTWSEATKSHNEDLPPSDWKFAEGPSFDFRPSLDQLSKDNEETEEGESQEGENCDFLFDLWTGVIGNLSERNLSFETDILFAGAGMFSLLQKIFNVNTMYGLPERRLEEFLFWSPMTPGSLRRRHDLANKPFNPSWSWAGWVGEILPPAHTPLAEKPTFDDIDWKGLERLGAQPNPLQSNGRGTVGEDASMSSTLSYALREASNLEFPLLQCKIRPVQFRISSLEAPPDWIETLQTYTWTYVPPEGKGREGVYCIIDQDKDGDVVGSVVFDSKAPGLDLENRITTFAIISSKIYQSEQYEGIHPLPYYRVLALQADGAIFERVGHGAILQQVIDHKCPPEETIILG